MKKVLFVLLFFLPVIVFSQQPDMFFAPDSVSFNRKIIRSSQNYLSPKSIFIPGVFIAYGLTSLDNNSLKNINLEFKEEIQEAHPLFKTKFDDYLMFSPAAGAFVLEAAGIKGRHNLKEKLIIYGTGLVLITATVSVLKKITRQLRPDGSKYNSFPSGHTATAFMSAEFLSREYKSHSYLYSAAGYAAAGGTAALRMYNNKHWFADVVAGAGIGVLSTKLSYWIFNKIDNKRKQRAIPGY